MCLVSEEVRCRDHWRRQVTAEHIAVSPGEQRDVSRFGLESIALAVEAEPAPASSERTELDLRGQRKMDRPRAAAAGKTIRQHGARFDEAEEVGERVERHEPN